MNPVLTPEIICELDTFTLEEKIEELDNHPQKELYAQIIQIAKLELIDRLEIQEFGRQLANDEYKIDLDFNLPSITPKEKIPSKTSVGHNRKQIVSKMQLNIVAAGSFLTVGKPAVSHHYKPKAKNAEPIQKPKSFLKAKKFSYSKPKQTILPKSDKQQKIRQSIVKLPEPAQKTKEQKAKKSFEVKEQCIKEAKVEDSRPEFSLKQKLKKQVQEMKVLFRENDAYDDMRVIKLAPLNLKDEEERILGQETAVQTEIVRNTNSQRSVDRANDELLGNIAKDKEEAVCEVCQFTLQSKAKSKMEDRSIIHTDKGNEDLSLKEKSSRQASESLETADQRLKLDYEEETKPSIGTNEIIFHKDSSTLSNKNSKESETDQYKYSPSVTVLQRFYQEKDTPKKEIKSKSVKSFNKKIVQNINNNPDQCELITSKLKQFTHESQLTKNNEKQQKPIKSGLIKMRKSGLQHPLKPVYLLKPSTVTFPYNQILPSFQKLFPHSKNLLITLRNVEQNLRMHFEKGVIQKCLIDQFRKVSEEDLTFKVVSESQKAKRYRDLFNISLESFYERGKTMLRRLKNDEEDLKVNEILLYRVVRTKEEVYDIINSSFHRTNNWYELPHGLELKVSWNLLWTWSKPQIDFQDLLIFQKVNHFIGNKQIARKDLLKKNIEKVQKLGNKIKQYFDIIPETFLLPGQNIPFIKKFRESSLKDPLNYWILKPVGLSRGRGISLINKLEDVVFSEPIVLQKYIMNPLLIDGFKFDMRIYVLVTSMNPLEAFIYREGFARLSTEAYSVSQQAMDNKFVHLTNFSIQRENLTEQKRQTLQENVGGSKISLKMLARKLKDMGIQWSSIQRQIEDIVLKSLIACMNSIPQNPNCFQLFGYDIFIDASLKCWLLEVNSSPSLEKEYTLDQIIKQQLVDDIIEIVNPVNYDRQRLLEIVERRRKEAEGLKSSINTHSNSSQQLNQDLHYILRGNKLRKYGEEVTNSNFKMIAPSEGYQRIVRILQQYKIDPIVKES